MNRQVEPCLYDVQYICRHLHFVPVGSQLTKWPFQVGKLWISRVRRRKHNRANLLTSFSMPVYEDKCQGSHLQCIKIVSELHWWWLKKINKIRWAFSRLGWTNSDQVKLKQSSTQSVYSLYLFIDIQELFIPTTIVISVTHH